jgi:prepilin-type N-terminal cleavage/methylation domain-containing protein
MNDQKGFTLIEVLLSVVLLGIIACVMVGMLNFYQKSFLQNRNDTTAFEDVNMAMQMMVREMRQGKNPSLFPTTGPTTSIRFEMPSGDFITYYLNGSQLMRKVGTTANNGTAQMVIPNVANNGLSFNITSQTDSATSFTYYTVTINLSVEGNAADNKFKTTSVNLVDSVTLRNQ